MIANRQRDIRRESERTGIGCQKSGVARPTQQSYIRIKPFLSPSLYIYIYIYYIYTYIYIYIYIHIYTYIYIYIYIFVSILFLSVFSF